jgi:hypothetical protein
MPKNTARYQWWNFFCKWWDMPLNQELAENPTYFSNRQNGAPVSTDRIYKESTSNCAFNKPDTHTIHIYIYPGLIDSNRQIDTIYGRFARNYLT